jgi:N-acetyl-alpha-D-muramate 1-phosphate uridylyltransferase
MQAMILAAGLGTRLKPFTNEHPKALAFVNNKPILQRNIEYLKMFGVDEMVINVHHFANQIIKFLESHHHFDIKIEISDETNEVLETGGGLKKAAWFFTHNKPFFLMNVDILTNLDLSKMLTVHQQQKPFATLAISQRESSRCFLFNAENQLCGWRNKATGEEKIARKESIYHERAFSGLHLIEPTIFTNLKQEGKFSMVDVYLDLAKNYAIVGYDHTGCDFIDVGKPESILKAETMFI